MKISIKLLFLFSTLVLALSLEIKKEFEKGPIYEIPFIKKNDSPVSNNFNPRIENINLSSQEKVKSLFNISMPKKNFTKLKILSEQIL